MPYRGGARRCSQANEVCPHQLQHGTYTAYNNHGCRCQLCRVANTEWGRGARQRRRARMERGEVQPPHGVETTYFNYMCRCELCRRAHNVRQLERIRRRKQRLSDEYVRTLLEGMRDERGDPDT